ncbi:hypothetical protein EDB84DRAFT_1441948 [Lactarius hengduanensis]|nr:hypothetical protein EDB84DRAFT_1441948 [Lactarius hengduanensis]
MLGDIGDMSLLAILGARLELLELSLDGASDEARGCSPSALAQTDHFAVIYVSLQALYKQAFHMLRLWATLVTEGAKAEEDRSTLYGYGLRLHRHHRIARVSSYYHPDGNAPSLFVEHEHEPNSLPSPRLLDQPGRAHRAGGELVLPLWRTPLTTQCMGRCTWWRKLLATRVTRVWAQTPSSRFRDSRHGGDWAERISGQVATLEGEPLKEAILGALERVDDAAFADVQKPTGPTAMSGPDTWRRRRCTESLSLRLAFVLLLLHLRPSAPDRENLRHSESERKLLAVRETRAPVQVPSSYFLAMVTKQNDLARTERRRCFSSVGQSRDGWAFLGFSDGAI